MVIWRVFFCSVFVYFWITCVMMFLWDCGSVTLAGDQVPMKTTLSSTEQERKKIKLKAHKSRERALTNYHHGQKSCNLGTYYQSNHSCKIRSKTNLKKKIFSPPLFLPSSTFSLTVTQKDRKWRPWSVHHVLFLPLLLPQEEESFPCSCIGTLPQETVLHNLLHCGSPSME